MSLIWRFWTYWAHFAGILLIALVVGATLVLTLAGDTAVVEAANVNVQTQRVPMKGEVVYTYDLDRKEYCPGEIVTVYSSEGVPPAVVTTQRPSVYNDVRKYEGVRVQRTLPPSVTAGKWLITVSLTSHCANRIQNDPIATFSIEVTS